MDKHPQIENNLTKKRRVNRQLWEVTKKKKERYVLYITLLVT